MLCLYSQMMKKCGFTKVYHKVSELERELQTVQLSATTYSCIAILWVSLGSFAAVTLCIASQRVIPKVSVYFVIDSVRKLLDTPSYIQAWKLWKRLRVISGIWGRVFPHGRRKRSDRLLPIWNKRSWHNGDLSKLHVAVKSGRGNEVVCTSAWHVNNSFVLLSQQNLRG
jgi:hypothetical protein